MYYIYSSNIFSKLHFIPKNVKKEQATAFLQQSVPFSVMSVSHHQRHLHPECLTLPDHPHFFSMLLKSNVRPHLHRLPRFHLLYLPARPPINLHHHLLHKNQNHIHRHHICHSRHLPPLQMPAYSLKASLQALQSQ